MTNHTFPQGYSAQEPEKLAEDVLRALESGISARMAREERWRRNRSLYYNEPAGRTNPPFPNSANEHWNLTQVKLDTLGTHAVGTIVSQEPYCVAEVYDGEDTASKLEKVVQFFAKSGKLEEALKAASPVSGWSNHGYIKVEWDYKYRIPRFRFWVREPFSIAVYPAMAPTLEDASLVGDRFYRTVEEINQLRASGEYLDGKELKASDDPDRSAFENMPEYSGPPRHESVSEPTRLVELWDVFYKVDGQWYSLAIARADRAILRCELWEEECLPYAEFGYKSKSSEEGYWGSGSVGQDLQGPQLEINELVNLFLDGMRFNFSGLVTAETNTWPEKFMTYNPGTVISGAFQGVQYHSPKADLSPILPMAQAVMANADVIVRISQAGAGGALPGNRTATEASIIGAGQRAGIDEYISTFGSGVETLFKIMQEKLHRNLEDWYPKVGEFLEVDPDVVVALQSPCNWSVNASSVGVTPAAQMQTAMMLVDFGLKAPEAGIDMFELGTRLLDYAQRQGFTNADGLQMDRDPLALLQQFAEAAGFDPVAVAQVLDVAIQSGVVGVVEQQPDAGNAGGASGAPQGMPGPVGASPGPAMSGIAG